MFYKTSGEKISPSELIAPATALSVLVNNPKQTGIQFRNPIPMKKGLEGNQNLSQEEVNIILHLNIKSEEDLMIQMGMMQLPHQDGAMNYY